MALATIAGGLLLPAPPQYINNSGAVFSFLIDDTAEKVAMGYVVPKTGTLSKVGFVLGTVTQAPTNGLRVSFQDRDVTTGDPDGTQDQYRDVTSGLSTGAWIETGILTSNGTDGGTKRSVTAGDYIFVVIEFTSFNASDSLNIGAGLGGFTRGSFLHSSCVDAFTAAWAKSVSYQVNVYLEYDDGTTVHVPGVYPTLTAQTTLGISTATNPDIVALIVTPTFSCRAVGAWVFGAHGSDDQITLKLYDTNGSTVLGTTATFDEDWGTESGVAGMVGFFTGGGVTLAAGSTYRVAVVPSSGTFTLSYAVQDTNKAKVWDAWELGQMAHWSQQTDAGAWTENTLRRPFLGLILDQLDDGAGGGGLAHIIGG